MCAICTHALGPRGCTCGVCKGGSGTAVKAAKGGRVGLTALSGSLEIGENPGSIGVHREKAERSSGLGMHSAYPGAVLPGERTHGRGKAEAAVVGPGGPTPSDRGESESRGSIEEGGGGGQQ